MNTRPVRHLNLPATENKPAYQASYMTIVKEELDTGEDRLLWVCLGYPLKDECSAASWSRASVWSYTGLEEVRERLKKHLLASSPHSKDEMNEEKL